MSRGKSDLAARLSRFGFAAWQPGRRLLRLLPLLVLLAGLVLTLAYWRFEWQQSQATQRRAFESEMHGLGQRFLLQMSAQRQLMQGVQGFLQAQPQADAAALRRYIQALPLDSDFAGLQGLMVARSGPATARVPGWVRV